MRSIKLPKFRLQRRLVPTFVPDPNGPIFMMGFGMRFTGHREVTVLKYVG